MPEGFFKFPLYIAENHLCRFPSSDHINIDRRKFLSAAPEDFSGITLYPVTDHRATYFLADSNPKTCLTQTIWLPDNEKTLGI